MSAAAAAQQHLLLRHTLLLTSIQAPVSALRRFSTSSIIFKKAASSDRNRAKQHRPPPQDVALSLAQGLQAIERLKALARPTLSESEGSSSSSRNGNGNGKEAAAMGTTLTEGDAAAVDAVRRGDVGSESEMSRAASVSSSSSSSSSSSTTEKDPPEYGPPETIYTANPSFPTPLVLTATFVAAVFALNSADMARTMWTEPDAEGKPQLARAWKRYAIAGGFAAVAVGVTVYGVTAPARIITRLTIRRPITSSSSSSTPLYPAMSKVTIHTPMTRLPLVASREVRMEQLLLLGPLSDVEQSYHPKDQPEPVKPKGPIRRFLTPLSDLLIAPRSARSKKAKNHWQRAAQQGIPLPSHIPLLVLGDRASYSMAVKRGQGGMGGKDGAWCEDWERLERALLGVAEAK